MKKLLSAAIVSSMILTATMEKARSAEIILITTGGIVATVVVYGLGYAGYGSGMLTLGLANRKVNVSPQVYQESLDVVAANDPGLITDEVAKFLEEEMRKAEPLLENASDIEVLNLAIDAANGS